MSRSQQAWLASAFAGASVVFTFPACSDDEEGSGGGATSSSSVTGASSATSSSSSSSSNGGGGGECSEGVSIDAAALKDESIAQLRAFFDLESGLDDGTLYYRDGVTSVNFCPVYDQSSVLYTVPVDPTLVPLEIVQGFDDPPHVNFNWGLNGHRYIFFSSAALTEPASQTGGSWAYDRFPISACATLADGTSADRASEILQALRAVAGEVPVELYVDTVLCWGPSVDDDIGVELDGSDRPYFVSVQAIAAEARQTAEVFSIEWSPVTYGLEWELGDVAPIEGESIRPECLRTVSRDFHQSPIEVVASLPSFGPPFGTGWMPNPDVANCP